MNHPALIVSAVLLMGTPIRSGAAEDFTFAHEEVMGTALELRVLADSLEDARGAEARVLAEIKRLSAILSTYDPSSELSHWLVEPAGPVAVSAELFEVLDAADRWRHATAGAFDPRADAFSSLWKTCAKLGRMPTLQELADARLLASREAWRLDPARKTAERIGNVPISLDGIAKGFIVERASEAGLDPARGVLGLLLNVGGDLRVVGEGFGSVGLAPPRGDSESSEPFTFLEVRDRSIATSGGAHRGWWIDGNWHSHIIDLRSGRPADRVASASVVSTQGIDADALATALNVMPVAEGLRLVESLDGIDCLIVSMDGSIHRSLGWQALERPAPDVLVADARQPVLEDEVADDGGHWAEAFELIVRFEINKPEVAQRQYRRPYVVIYIEDDAGHVVRHLLMWVSMSGSGPDNWLPDLTRWYRSDAGRTRIERRNKAYAIGRSTRPPGKYSISWDGKDDTGDPLPAGSYTIFVEAAREHGTHQVIRAPISIAEEPFAEDFEGNVEIKSATVEYRRIGPDSR